MRKLLLPWYEQWPDAAVPGEENWDPNSTITWKMQHIIKVQLDTMWNS